MEYIHHHIDTLLQILTQRLEEYTTNNHEYPPYLLFDFPGQVELYTHCTCVQNMLHTIAKHLDLRLCSIHLIDAHSCTDAAKFISASLLSTTTMLRLELPTINVLSKIDLLGQYYSESGMPFNLDFFLECQDLNRLLPYLEGELIGGHHHHHHYQMQQSLKSDGGDNDSNNNHNNKNLDSSMEQEDVEARIIDQDEDYRKARLKTRSTKFYKRHQNMHKELCEVVEDFGLLNFVPLNINDAESVGRLLAKIDKCNGYVFLNNALTEHHNSYSHNTTTTTKNNNQNNDTDKIQNKTYSKTDSTPKSQMHDMFQCALQMDKESGYEQVVNIQERVLGMFHDNIPELERKNEI
jgi:Tfp pilus assembly major pilin PilA